MKLSIVITYHNRRKQLLNTLLSIEATKADYPLEVIIVDDVSNPEHRIDDIPAMFDLPINLIVRKEKESKDPVVPHNIGFNAVTGDVILINCAECYHFGNILEFTFRNFKDNCYFAYSTYSISWSKFNRMRVSRESNNVRSIIEPTHPLKKHWKDLDNGWYTHPQFQYSLIPFCAAISTKSMEQLSGYDERYKNGIGWADIDFVDRVKNLGLELHMVDYPFCIHQPHEATDYTGKLNNELHEQLQRDEPARIKSPNNTYYVR